jgi:hypothetical protein
LELKESKNAGKNRNTTHKDKKVIIVLELCHKDNAKSASFSLSSLSIYIGDRPNFMKLLGAYFGV